MTLDSGALIAYERGERRAGALIDAERRRRRAVTVPTAVLTEVWRGGSRQHCLQRLLADCVIAPLDEPLARAAGELLGRTGTDDPVDAIVAQSAARHGDVVLTSDPDDLQRLADDLGTIRVRGV
ncbi:MAG: PIN domain-containing protein [Actinomycetota bacterium]|jgi:predicted nucleic acid-binding protein|nr:PIN domain-containing protein [Actinomycetota bacterium]